jgi:hypothetical protein
MWLRDFLSKDLPTCRTMIYGYNSKLLSQGIDNIMTYGLEFMEGLKRVRNTEEVCLKSTSASEIASPNEIGSISSGRDQSSS